MKRFTETNKWNDPWFMGLSPSVKLLWLYLLDHCDNAGVVEPNSKLASFQIGEAIKEKHFTELGDRLKMLPNGKFLIPKFIGFQFGVLGPDSRVHASVLKLLSSHGIGYPINTLSIPSVKGSDTLKDKDKDKDKDTDKDTDKDRDTEGGMQGGNGKYHRDTRTVLHWLNEASQKHFRETDPNLSIISARLNEPGVALDGVKEMIERQCKKWMRTDMQDYLRPETLFGKTKFDGYYAAKDQPLLTASHKPAEGRQLQENITIRTL